MPITAEPVILCPYQKYRCRQSTVQPEIIVEHQSDLHAIVLPAIATGVDVENCDDFGLPITDHDSR